MKHFYDTDLLEATIFGEEIESGLEMPILGDETETGWDSSGLDDEEEQSDETAEMVYESPMDGESLEYGEEVEDVEPAELIFTLTMEDGSEVTCRAECIFIENEKEYIALDMGYDEIQIMELIEGENDSITLLPVKDNKERELAFEAFLEIIGTERGEESL